MAKCIFVCSREPLPDSAKSTLEKVCSKISPDNIILPEPRIRIGEKSAFGIMNPSPLISTDQNSILMGQIYGESCNWHKPGNTAPDGSYAIFRDDENACELVTDAVATRTIWYYKDDSKFIASTSQRAIIIYLGTFEFNRDVIPWMLSTGSLGPGLSWDKTIKQVPPDSTVTLDKNRWAIETKTKSIEFKHSKKSDKEHERKLKEAIEKTFRSLNLNLSEWAIPLSGGYDSRAIISLLSKAGADIEKTKTVTWGLKDSINDKKNDAYIAKKIAQKYSVAHQYYHTDDTPDEPVEKVVTRILLQGEGRIDQISGYMDGFTLWKKLYEDGIQGTIRGDEGFGISRGIEGLTLQIFNRIATTATIRLHVGCCLCADYLNTKNYLEHGFPLQEMPPYLMKKPDESLHEYRDRLHHCYRFPTILSALSDLKLSYTEQITPFLSKNILDYARQLPDQLRTEKVLFKKIVKSISPKVPFATKNAIAQAGDILKRKDVVELITAELRSERAERLFPKAFTQHILEKIKVQGQLKSSFTLKSFLKKYLPKIVKKILRDKCLYLSLDYNILAFRVFMISRMNAIFTEDCNDD